MHLGKGQDHFADQFALRSWQLQVGVEGFTFQVANAFVPALPMLLDFARLRPLATTALQQRLL